MGRQENRRVTEGEASKRLVLSRMNTSRTGGEPQNTQCAPTSSPSQVSNESIWRLERNSRIAKEAVEARPSEKALEATLVRKGSCDDPKSGSGPSTWQSAE